MTYFEFSNKVSTALSKRDNRHYAFLLTAGGTVLCVGAHSGEGKSTYETAMVNALQNNHGKVGNGVWAICSYMPTQMCQGMAHMLGVHGIRYDIGFNDDRILPMKKDSWDERTFRTSVRGFAERCDTAEGAKLKWPADAAGALKQAKDTKLYTGFATQLAESMDLAVKTANATRVKESGQIEAALNILPIGPPPGGGTFDKADEVYTHMVFGMVGQTWNPTMYAASRNQITSGEVAMGNNIAGILLDADFKVVAWALNFAAENPTFHAETLMLQRFLRINGLQKLPPNYTLYTSLQPCDMCGSFLMHVGDKTKVVYCLKDVNLSTVLTQTKTPSAASERQVIISGNNAALAAKNMGAKLAAKYQQAQTHTAAMLSDPQDANYRAASFQSVGKRGPELGSDMRTALLQHSPFTYGKGPVGTLDSSNTKKVRLGFDFVKSADQILRWASSNDRQLDPKVKKAAGQGVEIFEALVAGGFTTAYGLNMINIMFEKQRQQEEAAQTALAATVGKQEVT